MPKPLGQDQNFPRPCHLQKMVMEKVILIFINPFDFILAEMAMDLDIDCSALEDALPIFKDPLR